VTAYYAHAQAPEESKERLLNLLAEGSPFGARILATAERLLPAIASTVEVIKVIMTRSEAILLYAASLSSNQRMVTSYTNPDCTSLAS